MRPLLIAAAVSGALALAAPGAVAAPRPQIVDPAGDSVPIGAGYDIVSALFKTGGVTEKVGRRTVYMPTKLVVVVTYAGDLPTDPYASQVVAFNAPGCLGVYLQRYYEGGTYATATCLGESFDFSVKTSGKTVTFTLPFKVIGKKYLYKGALLTGLRTYTALADPVLGYETFELTAGQAGTVDDAFTDAPYKIA